MRRHLLGIVGLIATLASAPIALGWISTTKGTAQISGMTFRIGLELGVLWLAWPDLARLSPRMASVGVALVLMLFILPRQVLVLGLLALVGWGLTRRWMQGKGLGNRG